MDKKDTPYPCPKGYYGAEPKAEATNDVAGPPYRVPWGKDGGHLEDATDNISDAVWNVPTGRRKGV